MKHSIPQMAVDTRLILQRLEQAQPGDLISYKELSGMLGRDVQREARSNLMSAIRAALSSEMVFGTVRNEGVKRLTDSELAGVGEGTRAHISRTARKAVRKMTLVENFAGLTNEEKIRHNTSLSMLGAVGHITSSRQSKLLESRVSVKLEELPLQKTLEAFMGKQD